jgi:hypothetical protein
MIAKRSSARPAGRICRRVIKTVARLAKVSASPIRHGRGGPLRMLCAWPGWYEGWHRLGLIAASLRLRSSGHISDLIEACERQLRQRHAPQQDRRSCVARCGSEPGALKKATSIDVSGRAKNDPVASACSIRASVLRSPFEADASLTRQAGARICALSPRPTC